MKKLSKTFGMSLIFFITQSAWAIGPYPSNEVLEVGRRSATLRQQVNQLLTTSSKLPEVSLCLQIGQISIEQQNLLEAGGHVQNAIEGTLMAGSPLPDWLNGLSAAIQPIPALSRLLQNLIQPCTLAASPGTVSTLVIPRLRDYSNQLNSFSVTFSPYVDRAIQELGIHN